MRVPDEVRDCVVFTQAYRGGLPVGRTFGSAFLVWAGVTEQRGLVYAVTAKHLLGDRQGLADEVRLIFNTVSQTRPISTEPHRWFCHPSADVAAYLLGNLDRSIFSFRPIDLGMLAPEEWILEKKIGPGDDLFITGLLAHHPGVERNMPIVRIGNIAALPVEAIRLDRGIDTGVDVVTLIEARSIGGISGSPVFVHLPFWRDAPAGSMFVATEDVVAGSGGQYRLLGLMHGYYNVGPDDHDGVSGGDENLNTGIAVVVKAQRILELLDNPARREERQRMKEEIEKEGQPTPTGGQESDSEYERFEDLAKKLVQVPKPELDAERKERESE